jgi:hypothetical protein
MLGQAIAQATGADVEEIIDLKDRSGGNGYLVGVKDAVGRKTTEIARAARDPRDYELIIIGTPVWAWSMSCAVRTYLRTMRRRLPDRIAFFCTADKRGMDRAFRDMASESLAKPVATLGLRMRDVIKHDPAAKVAAFVSALGLPPREPA